MSKTARIPDFAYIIYSADVTSDHTAFIERMSPAVHMTAGYSGEALAFGTATAAKFTQTEGDEQYDLGYLADDSRPRNPHYYPYGFADAEALHTDKCLHCKRLLNYNDDSGEYEDDSGSTACPRNGSELPHEPDEDARGQGQHRKWVAELTGEEWLAFAGAYLIGLDEDGMPEEYGETLGSLTAEYGLLPAVCVENGEGWDDYSGSQVIYSTFYVSLGYIGGPDISADEAALAAWETDGGAVVAVDVP